MQLKPLKVSELNQYIKRLIMSDPILYNINVEGEISNFKHHYNNNMYFTINDEKSKIKCIMFCDDCYKLNFELKNGMDVEVKGYVSVYDKEGNYQLYVKEVKKKGQGEIYESFQKLKRKLELEGLFNQEHKKTLPYLPKKIGVITSSVGAAVKDIVINIKRRMNTSDILIYQVMVQGEHAKKDICNGIRYFNSREDVDVIIIARGGGSTEELWTFNDENIAREIYMSGIPTISAVGHETDYTIADFVSDVRASTPSVAAEIVVPSLDDIKFKVQSLLKGLLINYTSNMDSKIYNLKSLYDKLDTKNPIYKLEKDRYELQNLYKSMIDIMNNKLDSKRTSILRHGSNLNALSPLSVLDRGYSITTNKDNKVITSIKQINKDDVLRMILSEGNINVKVIEKESKVIDSE